MVSYRHGFNVYDDTDRGNRSLALNAQVACYLGTNTLRIMVRWDQLQPTSVGSWDYTKLEELRQVVIGARAINPQVQVLPIFDIPPLWAQALCASSPTPVSYRDLNTVDLYGYFGYAASVAMKYLNGAACPPGPGYVRTTGESTPDLPEGKSARPTSEALAEFIEVMNEPNNNVFGHVSTPNYSGMAAYTLHWVRSCLPAKRVLIGSLSCDYHQPGIWTNYLYNIKWGLAGYLLSLYGSGWTVPYSEWRFSFHPYPHFGPPQSSAAADTTGIGAYLTVVDLVNQAVSAKPNSNGVWITETGANSLMTGNTGNAYTEQDIFTQYMLGFIASQPIEGAIWWTLADNDPQARLESPASAYYHCAVLDSSEVIKPAGSRIAAAWL